MEWEEAKHIKTQIAEIVTVLNLSYIDSSRIYCYKSHGSTSRSYARIWSFPKIFQHALDVKPAYVIEVLTKYYDRLTPDEQNKVLIHELLHIPKNFSGALLPHRTRGRHLNTLANKLYKQYQKAHHQLA